MEEEKKNSSLVSRKGMIDTLQHPASFRDPAGFIFKYEGKYYRQVNQQYASHFEHFKSSGLYDLLLARQQILAHTELTENLTGSAQWYKTLLPQQLDFISYPYEWSFSQWKDAALLTLELVKTAMQHGMILKDATPFNVQFVQGSPVFIDTLSFEKYDATKPWIAYRQFIECFAAPLLLARHRSPELLKMFQIYPGGIPLPLVSKLLPFKTMFNANVFLHIRLPGLVGQNKKKTTQQPQAAFSQQKLFNIISNLVSFIQSLQLPFSATAWNNYYDETILSNEYANAKMAIVENWLRELPGTSVIDIGANTGLFAKAAASAGKQTIAIDADSACIDKLYTSCRQNKVTNLLPLCIDITHPSPAIGWANSERNSFTERVQTAIAMALALIHHLVIGKNISFEQVADLCSRFTVTLIIEFVPKNDPKVQLLLQDREDIFGNYNEPAFLAAFGKKFTVVKRSPVPGTDRVLFLMERS